MAEYSLGKAEGEIVLTYRGADAVAKAQRDIDGLEKGSGKTASAFDKTGKAAGIAGLAIAGGLALAVNSAANFEQRISGIGAVSNATGKEMDAVRAKALQLGKDTKFSATDAASAIEELAKAGLTIPDILGGAADATVALAAAGEVELPRAAEIASNAMNMFNLTAAQMPHVADLLAGAANASAVSVDDLAMSLSQAGAVANTIGLSIDDTTAAIGLLGNAGIKGSDAGTSLKTMLLNLQPVTKKQKDLFKELGIVTADGSNKFFDAQGNVKSMAQISGVLSKALEGQSKQQKLATLETLFGTDAIRAAAVFADKGAVGFNKFSKSMEGITAADVAAKRMDNLKGDLETLKGSLETAGIAIGTVLIPILRDLSNAVAGVANWFLTLSESQQKWITVIIAAIGGILLIIAAIIKITLGIRSLILTLEILKIAFAGTWVAALGPIALVIAAVAAVIAIIVLLWKNSETFRNIVLAVWAAVKAGALAVAAWFAGPFANFFITAYNMVKGIFLSIYNAVASAINAVRAIVMSVVNAILAFWRAGWDRFGPIITAVFNLIKVLIQAYIIIWISIIRTYLAVIEGIFHTVWGAIRAVTSTVWNAIRAVIAGVVAAISAVVNHVLSPLVGIVRSIFSAIDNAIGDRIRSALATVRNGVSAIKNFFSGAAGWLIQAGRDIISGLIQGIGEMAGQLLAKVTDMVNAVTGKIKGLFKIGSPSKVMRDIGHDVGAGLAVGISQSADDIAKAGAEVGDHVREAIKARLESKDITSSAATGLNTFMTEQLKSLKAFADQRDAITERLKVAREKLDAAIKVRDDFASQVAGQAIGFGNVTGITTPDADGQEVIPTAAGLIAGLAERRDAIIGYKNTLAALAAQGLNKTSFDQLVQAGVEAGTGYANAILSGGAEAITTVNGIQSDINSAATTLGTDTAAQLYQAGVDAAQGLVNGLRSKQDEITKLMQDIAKRIVRMIKKTLGIKSPSRVMIETAAMMMRGLIVGIDGAAGDVLGAMRNAVSPLPNAVLGVTTGGVRPATVAAGAGTQGTGSTVDSHDVVTIEAHTDADPEEIVDEYVWAKRTKLIGARR